MTMPNTAPMVAVPPGADPMETLLRETERRAHERGWDAGNNYHALFWSPELQGLSVAEVTNLSEVTRYAHPVWVLRLMAQFAAEPDRPLPTEDLVGWMVCFEAWSVCSETEEDIARTEADALARRLYTRADRVETRLVAACLTGGDEGSLARFRGADGQPDEVHYSHERIEGEIGVALRELVAVCAARTEGAR